MRPVHARPATTLALLAGLLLASSAGAAVYLNGVRIDGAVRDQVIEKATVRIDAKGDVYIEAAGYAVRTEAAAAPVPPPAAAPAPDAGAEPARLTRRYLLVTQQPVVGAAAYDVDLFVNGRWVRRLQSAEQQVVMDLTPQLVPGRNTVQLAARKLPQELRKSDEAAHVFRVLIGEGATGKGDVVLERPLVTFTRSAAEDRDITEQFTITTR